jgi:hypothetical protein
MTNFCQVCGNPVARKAPRCRPCYYKSVDKGGYHVTEMGYLRNNQTKKFMHREVMERRLGRELRPLEYVHHINGVKNDNRPENLELIDQPTHIRHHRPHSKLRRHPEFGYFVGDEVAILYTNHILRNEKEINLVTLNRLRPA